MQKTEQKDSHFVWLQNKGVRPEWRLLSDTAFDIDDETG